MSTTVMPIRMFQKAKTVIDFILSSIFVCLKHLFKFFRGLGSEAEAGLTRISRVAPDSWPSGPTIIIALCLLAIYLGFGVAAVLVPTERMRLVLWVISIFISMLLILIVLRDRFMKGDCIKLFRDLVLIRIQNAANTEGISVTLFLQLSLPSLR